MDLNFWLSSGSLAILAYAGYTWWQERRAERQPASEPAKTVKNKPRLKGFTKRSRGSSVQNDVNAGSRQQDAEQEPVNAPSVQTQIAPTAPAGAPGTPAGDVFTLSPREMVQLGEALNLYREGATIEDAVCRAFGVTKGGSEGWKRAKSLFDAATVPPGAAPVGTYAAARPVKRRQRVVAR